MDNKDLMIISFWKYIRNLLFSHTDNKSTVNKKDSLPGHINNANPENLIISFEKKINKKNLNSEEIDRYQQDVNYLIDNLDDNKHHSKRHISQIYELQSLIYIANGDKDNAKKEIESAISLNKTGKWIKSDITRKFINNRADTVSQDINEKYTVNDFNPTEISGQNPWTDSLTGEGYSDSSRWNKIRQQIFLRDNFCCIWCGTNQNLTVDHIKELSMGGTNQLDNLRTLCKDCHEKRHNKKIFNKAFTVNDNYGFNYHGNLKITALIDAAESKNGIGIDYTDREGLMSERVIHPIRIYEAKYIYVNAFCDLDNDIRTFRLSNITISDKRNNLYHNESNTYTGSVWKGSKPFNSNIGKTIYSKP